MRAVSDALWAALLEARGHDWDRQPSRQVSLPAGRLTLTAPGRWDADFDPAPAERRLLDAVAPIVADTGVVVGQLGQSLDGRIATVTGHAHYINGEAGLCHLHRLRALVDAVVIGAGTACADRPRLTVRNVPGPSPVRVLLDPNGRVPIDGPLFEVHPHTAGLLHVIGPEADPGPAPDHVERLRLPCGDSGMAPSGLLAALRERGLRKILVEGGADTISRFIDGEALDRLHLLVAPLIIGSGRNGIELPVIARLDQARRPSMNTIRLDDELLIDVDLRSARS